MTHPLTDLSPPSAEDQEAPRNFDGERIVTIQIAALYVRRFPHLRHLQANLSHSCQAHITFAQNALRLEAPKGVTALDIWHLSALANGED